MTDADQLSNIRDILTEEVCVASLYLLGVCNWSWAAYQLAWLMFLVTVFSLLR